MEIQWLTCLRLNSYWDRSITILRSFNPCNFRCLDRSWRLIIDRSSDWYCSFWLSFSSNFYWFSFSLWNNFMIPDWNWPCSLSFSYLNWSNLANWSYFTSDRSLIDSHLSLRSFNSHLSLRSFNSNFSSWLSSSFYSNFSSRFYSRFNSNFSSWFNYISSRLNSRLNSDFSWRFCSNFSFWLWFYSNIFCDDRSSFFSLHRSWYSDIISYRSFYSDWLSRRIRNSLSIISSLNSLRTRSNHHRTGHWNLRSLFNRSSIFNNSCFSNNLSRSLLLSSSSIRNSQRLLHSWLFFNNLYNFTSIKVSFMILNPRFNMIDSTVLKYAIQSIRYFSVIIFSYILLKLISSFSKSNFFMITNIPWKTWISSIWFLIDFPF